MGVPKRKDEWPYINYKNKIKMWILFNLFYLEWNGYRRFWSFWISNRKWQKREEIAYCFYIHPLQFSTFSLIALLLKVLKNLQSLKPKSKTSNTNHYSLPPTKLRKPCVKEISSIKRPSKSIQTDRSTNPRLKEQRSSVCLRWGHLYTTTPVPINVSHPPTIGRLELNLFHDLVIMAK